MSLRRSTSAVLVGLLALLLGTLTLSTTSALGAPAPGQGTEKAGKPLRYVALGDSYSAASGVLPLTPGFPPQCLQSTRNYPHVIAKAIGARLTDVSCGAAETKDFKQAQHDDVPPQLDALGRRTRLVTMTIGGNDSGVFINSILQCGAAGLASGGRGSPCQDQYGDSFVTTLRQKTFPSLVKALRSVKRAAPRARVAILGYPWIMPKSGGCYPTMPVARGDVPYLRDLQRVLNNAVKRAARRTGTTYVNLNRASNGHDACAPFGTRWVEPVLAGTNPVIVHPNALGERAMAHRTMKVLGLR